MCTAISYKTKDHYFGRNLDLERNFGERVVITPRNYPLEFRRMEPLRRHYAMIGMALVEDGYPLYFDAVNEKGLSIAGLNFPGNAVYGSEISGKDNIAPFELIPWLLGQCADLREVRLFLERLNLIELDFSERLPLTPLHWMISDRNGSVVVERVKQGLRVYDNPTGVLTNSPPFDVQLFGLNNYMHLSADPPENRFSGRLDLDVYSLGMGALGLPGDFSSMSRFVRAVFLRENSVSGDSEEESVSQFFRMLSNLAPLRGVMKLANGLSEIAQYSCCCNADRGIYYYVTYENSRITAVDMYRVNLDGSELISYPLVNAQQIYMQN